MFIGVFFLLFGLSIILKAVFHIDLPLFRVLVGLFLIFVGAKMVLGFPRMGMCRWGTQNSAVFSRQHFTAGKDTHNGTEYNIVFGEGTVDLTDAKEAGDKKISVNTVFGSGIILYNPKQSLKITTNSVFGHVETPDGQATAFGENSQQVGSAEGVPLKVHVNSVFGSVQFQPKG